ncbi:MAG: cadherin repeat domain-containing protein [Bacteroidota bacterium]
MRKLIFIASLTWSGLVFGSTADPVVIEITDTTMSSVYYQQQKFSTPTKLVFKNLTSVDGDITFHMNSNLVEVDFPLLKSANGIFYAHQNLELQKISAPNLTSVVRYLYVYGNTSLIELNVCKLKDIFPPEITHDPYAIYYKVMNNTPVVDAIPLCFSQGGPVSLALSNNTISEDRAINSLVGKLSATAHPNDKLAYFLSGDLMDNFKFRITKDSLLSASGFDYETKSTYDIGITEVNQLGERIEKIFSINISPASGTQDTAIIEITETNLPTVYYQQQTFSKPTKLVFKNLTTVAGHIYFHNNTNLVSVDFPLLKSSADIFYFYKNVGLRKINAPNLTTVGRYLYVYGNASLEQLAICNLKEIQSPELPMDPYSIYYTVSNNTAAVDKTPLCFSNGAPQTLSVSNRSVKENQVVKSLVGKLSATAPASDKLRFFLSGDMADNNKFMIRNDSLLTASSFDFETRNSYIIKVTAINQLGERTEGDFTVNVLDIAAEDTTVLVINDAVMSSLYYHQTSFTTPTKLLFKNLTAVTGSIYFHQVANLVQVDFPLLDSTGGFVYFNQNESLKKINAPVLRSAVDYLYVYGNASLNQLDVCQLKTISPSGPFNAPYYFISNNNNLDQASVCLTKTNVIYVPVNNILVKSPPNTLIGYLIADAAATETVQYNFVDSEGKVLINPYFEIRGASVYLTKDFSFYTNTNFTFDISGIRIAQTPKRPFDVAAGLHEKIVLRVNTSVAKATRYTNEWIGKGLTAASSAWENPGNWSLNTLPDANTDVVIRGGKVIVGTNGICRTITLNSGANFIVKAPFKLTIIH